MRERAPAQVPARAMGQHENGRAVAQQAQPLHGRKGKMGAQRSLFMWHRLYDEQVLYTPRGSNGQGHGTTLAAAAGHDGRGAEWTTRPRRAINHSKSLEYTVR